MGGAWGVAPPGRGPPPLTLDDDLKIQDFSML